MKHLVIGRGQVGTALIEVLRERYDVWSIDADGGPKKLLSDVVHVCFPYDQFFDSSLERYKLRYLRSGGLVIIHSTVPLGTSAKHDAVHSPIRGVHPNLAEGIRTFAKFFGGPRAKEAAIIFWKLGIQVTTTFSAMNTEALKLWDTTYYGWNIVFEKAVKAYCDELALDFDIVYTQANKTYNRGYAGLGMGNVQRPVLEHREGPIGGHCVIPNAKILGGEIAQFILEQNYVDVMKAAA